MKNILFATTALVATAGIASADVSLSGAANVGIVNNGTAAAQDNMYQNMSITATMAGETDGGLTFGASLTVRNGDDVDLDAGDLQLNDVANAGDITALSDTSFGSIYVSGDFGKLTFDRNGLDNVMDDDYDDMDVQYDYSVGDLSVSVTADIDNNDAASTDHNDWAAKVGYTMGAIKLTAATDDSGESDVTVAYTLNDMIGLSVNLDSDGQTVSSVVESEATVKATYSNAGITGHLALTDDDDDSWEVGFGYTAGAMAFGVTVGEDGDGTDNDTDITASYDLGGGMSVKAATNQRGAWFVGTALSF